MGRKKKRIDRGLKPDYKYNSIDITKFINYIMKEGKKTVAEKVVYKALDIVQEKTKENPLEVFEKALENVKPIVEVKSRRIGGATYQIPVEVPDYRQFYLACNWIIDFANKRKEKGMPLKLANELIDAYKGVGSAIKKREDTHKMAEANRAFAHLRW